MRHNVASACCARGLESPPAAMTTLHEVSSNRCSLAAVLLSGITLQHSGRKAAQKARSHLRWGCRNKLSGAAPTKDDKWPDARGNGRFSGYWDFLICVP